MRHLIDTYIEATEPKDFALRQYGSAGLIVKTGIADAIAAQLGNEGQRGRCC
jgi:hypothetical protein